MSRILKSIEKIPTHKRSRPTWVNTTFAERAVTTAEKKKKQKKGANGHVSRPAPVNTNFGKTGQNFRQSFTLGASLATVGSGVEEEEGCGGWRISFSFSFSIVVSSFSSSSASTSNDASKSSLCRSKEASFLSSGSVANVANVACATPPSRPAWRLGLDGVGDA